MMSKLTQDGGSEASASVAIRLLNQKSFPGLSADETTLLTGWARECSDRSERDDLEKFVSRFRAS